MHREDVVAVKNPDPEIRRKMHAIATMLGGSLQGEEGEGYGADGEPLPAVHDELPMPEGSSNPWWKFWA